MFNNRWRKVFFTLTSIVIFAGVLLVKAIEEKENRQTLRDNLAGTIAQYDNGELPCVDIPSTMNFAWDSLYVFRPYRSPDEIDSIIGRFWLGSRFTSIETNEGISLLVFTKNGRVVQYIEFTRGRGDFAYADNGAGYAYQKSCFIKDERGYMILDNR